MGIKIINHKDISRIIMDEPKTYNSLSFKNLTDLIKVIKKLDKDNNCLLYTSPSPRDKRQSRMPSSA